MTTIVKNVGIMQREKDTKGFGAVQGDQGTVRVVFELREYVFGPNQSISFSDDGIAAAVAALDARLRVATQADGIAPKANASTSWSRF